MANRSYYIRQIPVYISFVLFSVLVAVQQGNGQTFLNGDMEINTANPCDYNLSNAAFTAKLANATGYGAAQELDIMGTTCPFGVPQNGNWFVGLAGWSDAFTMQLSQPLVSGSCYIITFWDKGTSSYPPVPPAVIGLSTTANTAGTNIFVGPVPTINVWNQRSFTFNAPNNGQYISVAVNQWRWLHVDNFVITTCNVPPTTNFEASDTTICVGDCIDFTDLSAGSPTSWLWTFPGGLPASSTLQNPTNICYNVAGTYDVTLEVTNISGTHDTTFVGYITVGSPPTLSTTTTNVSCFGDCDGTGTVNTAGGTPPFTYLWDPPANNQTTQTATGLCAGTFSVTVTDDNGCTAVTTVTITEPPQLTATITSSIDVDCNGNCNGSATVLAGGGIPGYTYLWPSGGTTVTETGLCGGSFTVTITDASSCTATATVIITEPPAILLTTSETPSNCGMPDGTATVTAAGGFPGYTYQWDANAGNQTTQTATGLIPGSYCVTVTDANLCTNDTCVTVTLIGNALTMTLTFTAIVCNGQGNGTGTVTPTTGLPPHTYLWDANAGNQTTQTATGLGAGTYFVTITDNVGCTGVGSITITEPPPLTAITSVTTNYNGSDVSCNGYSDGEALVIPGGGTPGYIYLWSNGQNTQTTTGLIAGTYTVTVTDANGCTKDTTITLTEPAPLIVDALGDTTICIGTSVNISAMISGGTPAYTELWAPPLTGNGPHQVNPAVNTCYPLTVTDVNNCPSNIDSVCVNLYPPITFQLNINPDSICDGETVTFTVTNVSGGLGAPYTYTWNTGATTQAITVTPGGYPNTQVYTVTVSDGCSPSIALNALVAFHPTPIINFVSDEFLGCEPFTVNFFSTSVVDTPATCEWEMGDGTIIYGCDTITHTYYFVGTYDVTLTVTSAHGCSNSLTYPDYINVRPNPIADFTAEPQPTTVINTWIDFTDRSEGSVYLWNWVFVNPLGDTLGGSNEQNPGFQFPGDTGLYPVNLYVVTTDGCEDDTTKMIEINGIYNIFVPNAFTPNNDGLNEEFFPKGVGFLEDKNFTFTIYDRWGEIIFQSTSLDDHWDGTARKKGGTELVAQGVYVWRLQVEQATRDSKDTHEYVGHVTLIK